ncbi:MAG: hypothetical protein K1X89_11360 [Myxococcaceae bacterium]|nr:hypothetical protein [Myxococcaceae bacterium]
MQAFVFPSEQALRVALRSGALPAETLRGPVRVARLPGGAVEVSPEKPLSAAAAKAVLALGAVGQPPSPGAVPVSCWAAAVRPEATPLPGKAPPLVLFTCASQARALALAGELVRLGADRFELSQGSERALLKVPSPPWYALWTALEHDGGLRAFVPSPPGQAQVFVELGFAHPLEGAAAAEAQTLLLIHGDGRWDSLGEPRWLDSGALVVPAPLAPPERLAPGPQPRLEVTLTLRRSSATDTPALWFAPKGAAAVEALVRATPEDALDALTFAVAGDVVLLRPRPGRTFPGTLPGEPFARLAELPNLYLPLGQALEPPLRRDRLRSWLAADVDQVTLLTEAKGGGVALHTIPESAFRPLTEFVDYVLEGGRAVLETWVRRATFDFTDFTSLVDAAPQAAAGPATAADAPGTERPTRTRATARPSRPLPVPVPSPQRPPAGPTAVTVGALGSSEVEAALRREEAAFLELEAPADSPERRHAWLTLAELNGHARASREANLCWVHALWDAPEGELRALAARWAATSSQPLDVLLGLATPTPEHGRAVVAHALSAALDAAGSVRQRAGAIATFLDAHDGDLDVRTLWLGRVALARLSGGDALGLAKARDRVLTRLTRGLSLERDVPRFLRVTGQATGGGGERRSRVAHQLEAIWRAFHETPRKRTAVEAPPANSLAYVGFELAWGFARLGLGERARGLREQGLKVLPANDPVHGYLTAVYGARIEQALEGVAPGTPLPSALAQQLNALDSKSRYLVDRLRQVSEVLEPQERLDPINDYTRSITNDDKGREELGSLRELSDPAALAQALAARQPTADDTSLTPEERARLLDGLIDFLPQLPESAALPLLGRFIASAERLPTAARLAVLEDALKVAGHFGRAALVRQLALGLGSLLTELGPEGVAQQGPALASGVRSLRRVGLRDEAKELLARATRLLKGDEPRTLLARLALAQGFAYLGAMPQAQPVLDEAFDRLSREKGLIFERMKLTRAAAHALSSAPTEVALAGLLRLTTQLAWVTDSLSTGPHFCVSLVDYADALVLGHVGDDLTLNEFTRRFLEEDELLVRRRVHRDAGALAG